MSERATAAVTASAAWPRAGRMPPRRWAAGRSGGRAPHVSAASSSTENSGSSSKSRIGVRLRAHLSGESSKVTIGHVRLVSMWGRGPPRSPNVGRRRHRPCRSASLMDAMRVKLHISFHQRTEQSHCVLYTYEVSSDLCCQLAIFFLTTQKPSGLDCLSPNCCVEVDAPLYMTLYMPRVLGGRSG